MARQYRIPTGQVAVETTSYEYRIPGGPVISETAAATTGAIPLIGHGPGMSLAHVGGGLAGRANA